MDILFVLTYVCGIDVYVSVESHSVHLIYFENPFPITPSPALRWAQGTGACCSRFRLNAGLYLAKLPVYNRGNTH